MADFIQLNQRVRKEREALKQGSLDAVRNPKKCDLYRSGVDALKIEMAEVLQEPFCLEAISLHSGSISFGRFETEPLSWERRSAFSCNNYLEEVEKYSKPGSVNQRKAYFEVFFKNKGLLQPPDSLCQNWTECQTNEEEFVDGSNYIELCRERLPEYDEEISKNHSEHAVKDSGEFGQPQADHTSLQKKDKRKAYMKPKVEAETSRSHASSKRPENHQMLGSGSSSSSGLSKSRKVILEGKSEFKTASTKLQTTSSSSSNSVGKDSTHLQKKDLSRSHTVKQPVQNISIAKNSLSKTPKSMELREVEKQKQHISAKVKETGKAVSVLQTSNKRKDGSRTVQSASRPQKVARSSTEKITKPGASTVNSDQNGGKAADKNEGKEARIKESNNSKATKTPAIHSMSVPQGSGGKKAVPVHAETTKLVRKSSDPANKVTGVKSTISTSSSVRPLDPQLSKRSGTPSKGREKILPPTSSPGGKQVENKKHDSSPSQTVYKSSKVSKLQSQSSSPSPSPLRRDLRKSSSSSVSSSVKLPSSQHVNKTESPSKNHFPTNHVGGKEVENRKRDLSPLTVTKPSKLAKLQPKSSSLSPLRNAPSKSSTSSIKQLSSQCMNRTELPIENNFPTECSTGGKEVTAKKRVLDASQTVTKSSRLEKLQSKSSSLSPVHRSPSESSTSSLKQLCSQHTKRTESPMKNDLLTKSLPRGKEVTAKKRDSDGSQTVSKGSKLEKLPPMLSSPSPLCKAPVTCSKFLSIEKISSKTNRNASPMKNNLSTKSKSGGKEAPPKNRDSDILFTVTNGKLGNLQHESSSPISVLEAAATSSISSSVGGFSPQPDKGIETPKNRTDTKQVGTKKNHVIPLKRESLLDNKSTKSQGKPSLSASGPVGSTARTKNSESLGSVESVKAINRSESPRRDPGTGTVKRAVSVSNQTDKIEKRSQKVAAGR